MSVLRHNYLPLAGFWMLAAAVLDRLPGGAGDRAAPGRRRLGTVVTVAAVFAVLTVEAWFLQREIADYRLYGDLHSRLCQAFASVEPKISRERPVVLINRGTLRGVELMVSSVQGGNKTFFVRRDALWQLVFLPPLADFVGQPFDERLVSIGPLERDAVDDGCTVVLFNDNGFQLRPDLEDQVMTGHERRRTSTDDQCLPLDPRDSSAPGGLIDFSCGRGSLSRWWASHPEPVRERRGWAPST